MADECGLKYWIIITIECPYPSHTPPSLPNPRAGEGGPRPRLYTLFFSFFFDIEGGPEPLRPFSVLFCNW